MSKLVCEHLSKSYGGTPVLEDLNLTLESGKIYGLIGRNGAGKTTLLSIMSNQNPASGGCVKLDGENIWENRKALDRICFSRELNISAESGLANYTVKNYLKSASLYPTVVRTQYVFALLGKGNRSEAEKYKSQFARIAKSHPYPCEIDSERELMEIAEQRAEG